MQSGTSYKGNFFIGHPHGRGCFQSINLNVTYDGSWDSGYICGHGTLTMPDGTKEVRAWPRESRYGGGLSVRGAMELVEHEREQQYLDKLEER
ncbi:unnamed protein product, partial [Discosporangium mesarthrocarpum]